MKLVGLEARNFRSLACVHLTFGNLSVLIGENDSGKSSILDLLEISLGNGKPDEKDYLNHEVVDEGTTSDKRTEQAENIEVILELQLDEDDISAMPYAVDDILKIKKIWKLDNKEVFYWGRQITDPNFRQDFSKLVKADLEEFIQRIAPEMLSSLKTNPEKIKWLQDRVSHAETTDSWIPAPPRWGDFLPRFQRYRAMDYANPENIISKTLLQVYDQFIYQTEIGADGQTIKHLDKRLAEVKDNADKLIRGKIQELSESILRYTPQIKTISYEPQIDFSGGLKNGEIMIDDGRGLHYLSRVGDGTKRRISMATLEWDRDVTIQQSTKGSNIPTVIRGYDEPDTNLHYEAQRLLFRALASIADTPNSHTQVIICTHSLTMIDRAPAKSICLLKRENGCTETQKLITDDDKAIESFLAELAQELGISNTIMFYEKCFILVEGDTEANALPLFYRTIYGRSMLEDGIRIINVKGNGATKEFLKLMGKNKKQITLAFLDRDTEIDGSGEIAKLTQSEFRQAGFFEEDINNQLRYIGIREFEDAFTDDVIARSLQSGCPMTEGVWCADDIRRIRSERKLSDALSRVVFEHAISDGQKWGKPEFGKCLGKTCQIGEIPHEIQELFISARQKTGIT